MRVEGARLATESPEYGLADRFGTARAFQNRTVEWAHEGEEPIAVLRAPTGGGKTVTFHDLIDTGRMTLLVYPTNALLRQQRERFAAEREKPVAVLNSDSLDRHGPRRTSELKAIVNEYATDHDVVLTNPDILQAVVQDLYIGDHAMEFFDLFDTVVYDEFHFYDALAASGLLLQVRTLIDRQANPRILLASATPNEDFVEFLDEQMGMDICQISATYTDDGQQFRHPVSVERRESNRILDDRDDVAARLREIIRDRGTAAEPHTVLVFNSVRDSNDFHRFLSREYRNVFEETAKDNGFDTGDDAVDLSETNFSILNTTSKGEVGLDYDVQTLFMEAPYPRSAGKFLQRFGRAGRESPADVQVFGLEQGLLDGEEVSFPSFVGQVYDLLDTFGDSSDRQMPMKLLADLVGLRAAHAVRERAGADGYVDEELWQDFAEVDRFDRWRGFLRRIDADLDRIRDEDDGYTLEPGYTEHDIEAKLLRFTDECLSIFRGLRGQSLSASIRYPRGDRQALTSYSLTRTLRHYDIEQVTEGPTFHVMPPQDNDHRPVTARLPGYESQPDPFHEPVSDIETRLQRKIRREIDRAAEKGEIDPAPELLHRFFSVISIVDAVVPERLTTAEYDIEVKRSENAAPTVTAEERQR